MSPHLKYNALSTKFPVQPNGTEATVDRVCERVGLAQGMDICREPKGELALLFTCSSTANACPRGGLACLQLTCSLEKPDDVIKSTETRIEELTFKPFQKAEKEILLKLGVLTNLLSEQYFT